MTVHICRDLPLGAIKGNATGSYDTMWAAAVFLQGVLGYKYESSAGALQPPTYSDLTIYYYSASLPSTFTVISSSIVTINSGSCFLSGSGTHTLIKFSNDTVNLLAAAYPAGWPQNSGSWPTGNPFTTSSWVALKSTNYPLANSGIFVVTNSISWLNQNSIEIDYRSTSTTIQETGSLLTASFWQPPPGSDGYFPTRTGGTTWTTWNGLQSNNDPSRYQGQGTGSNYPRAVYVSPSPLSWRVRLAIETPLDRNHDSSGPAFTAIPGMSASAGDFSPGIIGMSGSLHLHVPQWFNYGTGSTPNYYGCLPGLDVVNVANTGSFAPLGGGYAVQYRFYAWGDDVTGTCFFLIRNQTNAHDCFTVFGQPENEAQPLPSSSISRLFVVGQSQPNQGVSWKCSTYFDDGITGVAYSADPRSHPLTCVFAPWAYVSKQQNDAASIRFDVTASDTPFLGATELVDVDLVAGTWDNWYSSNSTQNEIVKHEPRRMGRVPIARMGRATGQSTWTSPDATNSWFHVSNGFYMPWGGLVGL